MQIEFSPSAKNDLDEIFRYLEIENPQLAGQTIKTINNHIRTLSEFPQKGRLGMTYGTRELMIPKLPYCIPYEIYQDVIYVLRIYHTSRMPLAYKLP